MATEGKVYFYNSTTVELTVTLNGATLRDGRVPAGKPSTSEEFEFGVASVARVNSPTTDDPVFAEKNSMLIEYVGTGYRHGFEVNIPRRQAPLSDDLQLIVNDDGYVLSLEGRLIEYSFKDKAQRLPIAS